MINIDELRKKTVPELERLIIEAKCRIADLRYRLPNGEVKDTSEFRKLHREVARLKTILRQAQLGNNQA